MKKRVKVAVTGAAGQIGYALLFRIASGQMFGADCEVELQLIELETTLPNLMGVAMELDDCAFPLLQKVTCTSDLAVGFKDVDWAVLVGSVPRKDGMERADLLKINGGIFTTQGQAIAKYASPSVKVFVVGNPCNTNALICMNAAMKINNKLTARQFFAMTALDENRARTQLAKKAGVPVSAVTHMAIWGNHSATQYPDFYVAKINGKSAAEVINDEAYLKGPFIEKVQKRGAEVIKARGSSSAASAANAVVDGIYNLTHDTASGQFFSTCLASEGEYSVDKGLIFSMPCTVKNGVVSVVKDLAMNAFSTEKFQLTLNELRSERDTVKTLGLI